VEKDDDDDEDVAISATTEEEESCAGAEVMVAFAHIRVVVLWVLSCCLAVRFTVSVRVGSGPRTTSTVLTTKLQPISSADSTEFASTAVFVGPLLSSESIHAIVEAIAPSRGDDKIILAVLPDSKSRFVATISCLRIPPLVLEPDDEIFESEADAGARDTVALAGIGANMSFSFIVLLNILKRNAKALRSMLKFFAIVLTRLPPAFMTALRAFSITSLSAPMS
jgi:hypothetical protein